MFLEGQTPIWEGTGKEYREVTRLMKTAGYRKYDGLQANMKGEIDAYKKDIPGNRQNHVKACEEDGKICIYAHTEPSADTDPLGHLDSALGDKANFGAGAKMLRADMHAARRYVDSIGYREEVGRGKEPKVMGSCSVCGRAIWSPISLRRGIGSWCYRNR